MADETLGMTNRFDTQTQSKPCTKYTHKVTRKHRMETQLKLIRQGNGEAKPDM